MCRTPQNIFMPKSAGILAEQKTLVIMRYIRARTPLEQVRFLGGCTFAFAMMT